MLSWPDALCERLAAGGRRVVRYALRDSGESTGAGPQALAYILRDVAGALGGRPAHLAGIGVGGWSRRWPCCGVTPAARSARPSVSPSPSAVLSIVHRSSARS